MRETMKKILIVEDDRSLQHVLGRLLEAAGYSVASEADGVEALEQLSRNKFDLVLLDVGLPRLSGLEVLSRLRKLARRV